MRDSQVNRRIRNPYFVYIYIFWGIQKTAIMGFLRLPFSVRLVSKRSLARRQWPFLKVWAGLWTSAPHMTN